MDNCGTIFNLEPTRFSSINGIACQLIKEPLNSFSSFVYVLIGIYIFRKYRDSYIKWLGVLVILLGISSFIFHSTLTYIGEVLDYGSIFSIVVFVIFRNFLQKLSSIQIISFVFIDYIISSLILFFISFADKAFIFIILLTIILVGEILRNKVRGDKSLIVIFSLLGLFSAVIWSLDWLRIITFGHSLWHFITSMMLLILAKYLGKEKLN